MLVQLDAAERQQIVDQPRHAQRLLAHDGQEPVAGGDVVLGVATQGLDEAGQGRERRAELVAGVGQEVGPHALVAPGVGLVAHAEQGQALGPLGGEGLGDRAPDPVQRAALLEHRLGLDAAVEGLLEGLQHLRIADIGGQQAAGALQAQQFARRGVGEHQAGLASALAHVAGQQHRIRQALQHQGVGRIVARFGLRRRDGGGCPRAGPEQQQRRAGRRQPGRSGHAHRRSSGLEQSEDDHRDQPGGHGEGAAARAARICEGIVDRGHGDSPLQQVTPSHV